MRTIDFHTHLFTRDFFDALAGASPLPGSTEALLESVRASTGLDLPPPSPEGHGERWLGEMDAHGLDHLVAFASHPAEVEAVGSILELAAGRMTGMAMVDPTQKGADERIGALLAGGLFRGVLTFPAMHHFEVNGEPCRSVLAQVASVKGVCYVHCGLLVVRLRDLLGLPRNYDIRYANPLNILPAADAFPEVTFVVPHFGAGFLRETLMLGAQCPNVVVDTSSSNGWVRTQPGLTLGEVFERALEVFGPDRLLFGTDSGTFPAGWRADRRDQQLEILEGLGVGEEERSLFLAGNAARILNLP